MIPSFRNDILTVKDQNHDKNLDEDDMILPWQTLFADLFCLRRYLSIQKRIAIPLKTGRGSQSISLRRRSSIFKNMFMDRHYTEIKGTP
jgi:hypothetical protein